MVNEMKYCYPIKGVCSKSITFEFRNEKVFNISFDGGCPGNLKILSKILDGWKAKDIISMCKGNLCGNKATSCADQLSKVLEHVLEERRQPN